MHSHIMNNFRHSISGAATFKENHINWEAIVHQDKLISLERDMQEAVNLQHRPAAGFSGLDIYWVIWEIEYDITFILACYFQIIGFYG